jgi:hypothetical protein
MCLIVTDAVSHILEATALHKGEPTCRIALALQLVTLSVGDRLTLSLAKLPKHLKVYTVIAESLFHDFSFHILSVIIRKWLKTPISPLISANN